MEKNKLDYYRSILLERRRIVQESIEQLREMSQIKETELELNEKYSDNLADLGSDAMRKEESFLFISRELQYLSRIDNVLNSIDLGKYGICRICKKEISHERLEAVPTTDTCVKCKNTQGKKIPLN